MYCFCYDMYKKDLGNSEKRQAAIDFEFEPKFALEVDGKMIRPRETDFVDDVTGKKMTKSLC